MTPRPCSLKASTAAPSSRHCIRPGVCGNSGLAPMKAPAKSVPPDMLAQNMFCCAVLPLVFERTAKRSLNHCWVSADNGDPVEPSARRRDRPPLAARSTSALVQPAKNAAPAPKNVAFDFDTKRHNVSQSGFSFDPLGLPSKMQIVV